MRFGIGMPMEKTLDEVGIPLGVARERIRQIAAKTLDNLKGPESAKRLRSSLKASSARFISPQLCCMGKPGRGPIPKRSRPKMGRLCM
jgi:hypothetical protein